MIPKIEIHPGLFLTLVAIGYTVAVTLAYNCVKFVSTAVSHFKLARTHPQWRLIAALNRADRRRDREIRRAIRRGNPTSEIYHKWQMRRMDICRKFGVGYYDVRV